MGTGSTTVLQRHDGSNLAQYLREQSVADSTLAKYASAFRFWCGWVTRRGFNHWIDFASEPARLQLISDFIVHGFRFGHVPGRPIRSSSIVNNLMGIRHFFIAAGRAFPVDHPQIRMLLKGTRRLDTPSQRKLPVSIRLLESCFSSLNIYNASDQAMWRVLCLAFFFLLRRSEIVTVGGGKFRWFALRASDIAVTDEHGQPPLDPAKATTVHIKLRGSKTNQNGPPTLRMLQRSGHVVLCPVLGALLLMRARSTLPAELPAAMFRDRNGMPKAVTARSVSMAIQQAAGRAGESPSSFGTHSLRSGGATHMYRSGVDALTILFHGRWALDTYKVYTRLCKESVSSLSATMASGSKRLQR